MWGSPLDVRVSLERSGGGAQRGAGRVGAGWGAGQSGLGAGWGRSGRNSQGTS